MMEQGNARLRLGACWSFSIAAHLLILFSASFFIVDPWVKTSIDVTLTLPSESHAASQQEGMPASITYVQGQVQPGKQALRHRTLSDTQFESRDADYLTTWRAYIESTGTARYKAALDKNPSMKGALSMRVTIDASGALKNVVIEKSSGSKTLDQLALQIVKDAAPFQPLPDAMKKDTDTLDILRTWQFD